MYDKNNKLLQGNSSGLFYVMLHDEGSDGWGPGVHYTLTDVRTNTKFAEGFLGAGHLSKHVYCVPMSCYAMTMTAVSGAVNAHEGMWRMQDDKGRILEGKVGVTQKFCTVGGFFDKSPTPQPTVSMVPTLAPTGEPSLLPSSKPSVPPSGAPTPLPTIVPSSRPTTRPSLPPTSLPTLPPSHAPTPVPTLAPTRGCSSGEYLDRHKNRCIPCYPGFYNNNETGTSPERAALIGADVEGWRVQCSPCKPGWVAEEEGSGICTKCPRESSRIKAVLALIVLNVLGQSILSLQKGSLLTMPTLTTNAFCHVSLTN